MQNRAMYPETIAPPQGPYAHAVEIGGNSRVLHVAGQVGVDADGNLPDDFRAQALNVWTNLTAILEHNGMRMKDVVKINHFLIRREDLEEYGEIRKDFLGKERPASTLLFVAGLARPEFLIEVEMVAAISNS